MKPPPDKLSGKYVLRCSFKGCSGELISDQNFGVGWKVGQVTEMDQTNPAYARCPKCLRHGMIVVTAPTPPAPKGPKGFSHIPEK